MNRGLLFFLVFALMLNPMTAFARADAGQTDTAATFEAAIDALRYYNNARKVHEAAALFDAIAGDSDSAALFSDYAGAIASILDGAPQDAGWVLTELLENSDFEATLEDYGLPTCWVLLAYVEAREAEDLGYFTYAHELYRTLVFFDSLYRCQRTQALLEDAYGADDGDDAKIATYAYAEAMLMHGEYEDAANSFESLDGFRDSAARREEALEALGENPPQGDAWEADSSEGEAFPISTAPTGETIANSKDVIAQVGEEGLVLVRNDGLLPLSSETKALNVFGWGSTNPIFGGTGSGSSDGSSAVGILQSLHDAGYATNEELSWIYTDYRTDRPTIAMASQDWTLPEPTVDVYTDAVMSQAKEFSDTAVIVICRSGGEGADLPRDMYAVIQDGKQANLIDRTNYDLVLSVSYRPDYYNYTRGIYINNGSYDDFEPGEHYLELSVTEEQMVDKVCSTFEHVILVVNANNAMELGWINDYPQIGAVILAPGTGNTGMSALGKIISGEVNPSGKTVDTYVHDLAFAPTWNNVGNFSFSNVDDLKQQIVDADPSYEGNIAFVNYVEGIYVGYKFYETAAEEGLIVYDDRVLFPFGYGLSYTSFTQEFENFDASGDAVQVGVRVTNTGSVAGKDTVELYYTPPYTNGGIEKASVNLIRFAKTGSIEPGASESVSFSIPKEDFASYDSEGIKVAGGGYILEAGDYVLSLRSDSHNVLAEQSFTVDADVTYPQRASDEAIVTNQFEDYARGDFVQLSRADSFANYAEATAAPTTVEMSAETRAAVEEDAFGIYDPTKYDNADDVAPTLGAQNGKKLYELRGADYDDPAWEPLLDQLNFDDMSMMINLGGWQTEKVDSVGKVATSDSDGPAGLSNFFTGTYGTAYPTEVLMAQTWNTALIEEMGAAMGQEYADANNYGWYGPAMNTHRSAFAGRNFEYYSEDGVLAGYMAAAECNGAGSKGVYPYIKNFALNEQETNRCSFLLTYASEQAIREIYLKPFELAVKGYNYPAMACMSSFNFIGTEPCCANEKLLNNVLRGEWGFRGLVETDYNGSYGYQIADHCMRSGNDLMLGFASAASNQFTDLSATALLAMRQACKNILYTVVNSGYYANGDPTNS